MRSDNADGWEQRVDRGELMRPHRRADGTLLLEGYAARAGVLEYHRGGRIVRELVTEEVLADAAPGLARTVVTLGHPDTERYPSWVTPENVDELQVGDTDGDVVVEGGGFIRVKMAVRRRDAITAVDDGVNELSHGYLARVAHTPGTHPVYGRYDAVQMTRTTNHIAIVPRARGGTALRLRADGGIAVATVRREDTGARPQGGRLNAGLVRLLALLGVTSRVDSDDAAIGAACDVLSARKDAADSTATKAKADLDAMTAQRDAAVTRADRADAEVARLKLAETARVDAAERAELEQIATAIGVDPKAHADSKALRRAVACKHLGNDVRADASDDYIRAIVDVARKDAADHVAGRIAGREAWEAPAVAREDGDPATRTAEPKRRLSPSEMQRKRSDEAFQAARGGE